MSYFLGGYSSDNTKKQLTFDSDPWETGVHAGWKWGWDDGNVSWGYSVLIIFHKDEHL